MYLIKKSLIIFFCFLFNLNLHVHAQNLLPAKNNNLNITHNFITSLEEINRKGNIDEATIRNLRKYRVILIPGLLSQFMMKQSGHLDLRFIFGEYFKAHRNWLEENGINHTVVTLQSEGAPSVNAEIIKEHINYFPYQPLLIFSHSKGGIDVLQMLIKYPELSQRIKGIIFAQTPFFGAPQPNKFIDPHRSQSLATPSVSLDLTSLTQMNNNESMITVQNQVSDMNDNHKNINCLVPQRKNFYTSVKNVWTDLKNYFVHLYNYPLEQPVKIIFRILGGDDEGITCLTTQSGEEFYKIHEDQINKYLSQIPMISFQTWVDEKNLTQHPSLDSNDGLVSIYSSYLPGSQLITVKGYPHMKLTMGTQRNEDFELRTLPFITLLKLLQIEVNSKITLSSF